MIKAAAVNVIKLAIAGGLILWLLNSGQLDLKQLRYLITTPSLGLAAFAFWLLGPCVLGATRWLLLLKGAGYAISWKDAFKLQLTGFFFNSAMPGAVGGDLVKVVYVIKQNPSRGKTPAMMSVLIDRVIGLGGLFTIGMILALISFDQISSVTSLQPMIALLFGLNFGVLLFFFLALYHYKQGDPLAKLFSYQIPGMSILRKLYEAVRIYRYNRNYFIICFLLSLVIQSLSLALFYQIATVVLHSNETISLASIASIFPIGMLTAALPIAPGGLGVGHVAFDELFSLIGLDNGANIFNIFTLSQLAFNMLGVIPYIGIKNLATIDVEHTEKITNG